MWCWWCCHPWSGPDIHLPWDYDPKLKRFKSSGHFCSFECAKAYALDKAGPRYGEVLQNLSLMRKHALGHYVPLWPAPKRETLQVFGGPLTIDEFRKRASNPPWVHPPDVIHFDQVIVDPMAVNDPNGGVGDEPGGDLKLKRTKPLKRADSKLETALKLKKRVACP